MRDVWYFWQERFQQMVLTDHLAFMDDEKMYWWFSDREISSHSRSVLMLTPESDLPSN